MKDYVKLLNEQKHLRDRAKEVEADIKLVETELRALTHIVKRKGSLLILPVSGKGKGLCVSNKNARGERTVYDWEGRNLTKGCAMRASINDYRLHLGIQIANAVEVP